MTKLHRQSPGHHLLRRGLWIFPALLLSACKFEVLAPTGDVAAQQRDLLVQATFLMLIIIVPVLILTGLFAWHFRASNRKATYRPDWAHSTKLELAIWGFPVLIVVALGTLTWVGTHLTDPYRPLDRISADTPIDDAAEPLVVEVVALDWKWLFIYPEQGVAAVNTLAVPVDREIRFRLTSSSVMNAFYIPSMAGMIYAMPGMETTLHGVFNSEGTFQGLASHYSGAGFSGMRFQAEAMTAEDFDAWVAETQAGDTMLDRAAYLELAQPSENVAPATWAAVDPQLYDRVVNICVEDGKICMAEMMALDAQGGVGLAGTLNVATLSVDPAAGPGAERGLRDPVLGWQPFRVAGFCTPEEEAEMFGYEPAWASLERADPTPLRGVGLPPPQALALWVRPDAAMASLLLPPVGADADAPSL